LFTIDSKKYALDKHEDFMNQVIELPSSEYRMVSNEILSLLAWMKRFVEGLVEGEDNAN
jgi:CRISPR/Cas system CMR-associated protein Cmr5 small subunit